MYGSADRHLFTAENWSVLQGAFCRELDKARQADPLAPVHVLIPGNYLALHLGRILARNLGGYFNVRFLTLADLAKMFAEPALRQEGRRLIGTHAAEILMERICVGFSEAGRARTLGEALRIPGIQKALLATIGDLRQGGLTPETLETLGVPGALGDRLDDIGRIWTEYERRLRESGYYDLDMLFQRSLSTSSFPQPLEDSLAVFPYAFYDFNLLQRMLLEKVFERKKTVAFMPFGEASCFTYARDAVVWFEKKGFARTHVPLGEDAEPLQQLPARLFRASTGEAEEPLEIQAECFSIISAPGEASEVKETLRALLRPPGGNGKGAAPLARTAVILRHPEDYARLYERRSRELGIDPFIDCSGKFGDTREGAILRLLIETFKTDCSRSRLVELAMLAEPERAREQGGTSTADAPLWDLVTARAGIVEGRAEFQRKLAEYESKLAAKLEAEREDDRPGEPLAAELKSIEALRAFLDDLWKGLDRLQEAESWPEMTAALKEVFLYLCPPSQVREKILGQLDALAELQALVGKPEVESFFRSVEAVLEGAPEKIGRFQRGGPAVIDLMKARGIPFHTVVIPGVVEKRFPPAATDDPVLTDRQRKELMRRAERRGYSVLLPLTERRLDEERLLFALAVSAAEKRLVLSYPRLESSTDKVRLPSSFVIAAAEAVTGRTEDYGSLEHNPFHVRVPVSELFPRTARECMTEEETDLELVWELGRSGRPEERSYLKLINPFFARGARAENMRWGNRRLTAYDGFLAGEEARRSLRAAFAGGSRAFTATELEDYANCPLRFFLKHVLKLEEVEEPDLKFEISPADRGRIIHRILFLFLDRARRSGKYPLRREAAGQLFEQAERVFEEFERNEPTGLELVWRSEKERMKRILGTFLEWELEQEGDFRPVHLEHAFGPSSRDRSVRRPVFITVGKLRLALSGRIDRIDASEDGRRYRVIDYKTGRKRPGLRDDSLDGGRALQLPLYILATGEMAKEEGSGGEVESAFYLYVADRGAKVGYSTRGWERKMAKLETVLKTMMKGMEEGGFFPVAGRSCNYCEMKLACRTSRTTLAAIKSSDPAMKRFQSMAEID